MALHKTSLLQLLSHLRLDPLESYPSTNLTLVGHNWGLLFGAAVLKDRPDLFQRLVILNTNSLPDSEVDPRRYSDPRLFRKFLLYDAMFLLVPSTFNLLRNFVPLEAFFWSFNKDYGLDDLLGFSAPFSRALSDRGGAISFPLLVPVFPGHPEEQEFRETRRFLGTRWHKPTLIAYSEHTLLPWIFGDGDFIVGNRRQFFESLLPHARVARRIPGGHVIMYDNPAAVAHYVTELIQSNP